MDNTNTTTNMIIDITTVNIQRLKLIDLVNDATARGDDAAIKWLEEQAMTEIEVPTKDGGTKKKYQSVNSYRVEYLTKFCGYEKKEAVKLSAEQKRKQKLEAMFAKAKAGIQ